MMQEQPIVQLATNSATSSSLRVDYQLREDKNTPTARRRCRCLQFFESMAVCFWYIVVLAGVNLQFIPEFRTLGMALFDMPKCDCQGKNGHPCQTSKHVHNSKTAQAFSIVKPPKKMEAMILLTPNRLLISCRPTGGSKMQMLDKASPMTPKRNEPGRSLTKR